jgi:hypothetical protein
MVFSKGRLPINLNFKMRTVNRITDTTVSKRKSTNNTLPNTTQKNKD